MGPGFASFAENSLYVIFMADKSGKIVYINPAIKRLSGNMPEEIEGKALFSMLSGKESSRKMDSMKGVIANSGSTSFEDEIKIGDKSVPVEIIIWKIDDRPFIGGLVRNTTSQTETRSALQSAQKELRKRDDELERLTKLSIERELRMIELKKTVSKSGSKPGSLSREKALYGITDDEVEKSKIAILNMLEDIGNTNKELLDTQNKLREKVDYLEEVEKKKDEFISISAHELKTPITALHGFSQLLKNRSVSSDQAKRTRYLDIIESEAKRLAELITSILELSRIDLGTSKFVFEDTDVNSIVSEIVSEARMAAKKKGLRFIYKPVKLPALHTDKEKLRKVISNVVSNALKYTENGYIKMEAASDKESIRFTVKDTGIGIPEEYIDRIFERFFQADSSYSRKAGGSGLGLSLCKEFLNVMGGNIWAESHPGEGSTFFLTIKKKS